MVQSGFGRSHLELASMTFLEAAPTLHGVMKGRGEVDVSRCAGNKVWFSTVQRLPKQFQRPPMTRFSTVDFMLVRTN